ncbi:hypothetical protein TIFTF001_029255 [Ficus carica]|uniref:Uncharacterized protein n=1 Tax=Ficus carica TaxID=3494 RepID=A0AA88IXT1_FICCA|nr:hypothetical protein TIFTF001_029255 [Ficus carica]
MRGLEKTIVMRYVVEPKIPHVRIQCDADVNFYIQLKKNDAYVLSKFSTSFDILDESVAEAIPPEIGESNHIPVQPSRDGGQSNEAVQPVAVNNLIIPSPIVGMNHDDCNAREFNVEEATRDSNKKSIAGSVEAQSVVNRTRTQSVYVLGSDNFSGTVVVTDFTPITIRGIIASQELDDWGVCEGKILGSD